MSKGFKNYRTGLNVVVEAAASDAKSAVQKHKIRKAVKNAANKHKGGPINDGPPM